MRGEASIRAAYAAESGITPAHAGRSCVCPAFISRSQDHPRACGEKKRYYWLKLQDDGSPPRMRGEESRLLFPKLQTRITPAHAGRSDCAFCFTRSAKDHPRACGEKGRCLVCAVMHQGSPPRMRGEEGFPVCLETPLRITPAHAGRSILDFAEGVLSEDHPRACGEKNDCCQPQFDLQGSPPRMRGEDNFRWCGSSGQGITPAHAGRSELQSIIDQLFGDHPRACGEKAKVRPGQGCLPGSPPRMRGEVVRKVVLSMKIGITPAHAGRSLFPSYTCRAKRDHPRACGEKSMRNTTPA